MKSFHKSQIFLFWLSVGLLSHYFPFYVHMLSGQYKSGRSELRSGSSENIPKRNTFSQININLASANELIQLKGIGKVLANRIIQHRQAHGSFRNINQLVEVKGIGSKKLAKIKSKISVK